MRTFIRKVEEAIASGDKECGAGSAARGAARDHEGGLQGLVHRNAASRKVSRLAHRVEALA